MTAAVVTAAGSSVRMGGQKKEYRASGRLDADGRELTVLGSAVRAFFDSPLIDSIVITIPSNGEESAQRALPSRFLAPGAKPVRFVSGGDTRRRSVHEALKLLAAESPEFVLIHDGARPWIDQDLVARTVEAVRREQAVIPVLPLVETPKELDARGRILRHLKRSCVASAQTPQAFRFDAILTAHNRAEGDEASSAAAGTAPVEYTDDAELWGAFIGPVATITGSPANKKITFPEDLP